MPWVLCEGMWEGVWSRWHSIGDCQLVSDAGTVSEVGEGGVVSIIQAIWAITVAIVVSVLALILLWATETEDL